MCMCVRVCARVGVYVCVCICVCVWAIEILNDGSCIVEIAKVKAKSLNSITERLP